MELFLNILNSLICYRCNKCDLLTYCNIDCKQIHHHDGLINKYFIPIKCISNEFYINYFSLPERYDLLPLANLPTPKTFRGKPTYQRWLGHIP